MEVTRGSRNLFLSGSFQKRCRTEDTLACIVPLVTRYNWQCCFLFSSVLLCWKRRSIHKILWQKNSSWRCFLIVFQPLSGSLVNVCILEQAAGQMGLVFVGGVVLAGVFLNAVLFVLSTRIIWFSKIFLHAKVFGCGTNCRALRQKRRVSTWVGEQCERTFPLPWGNGSFRGMCLLCERMRMQRWSKCQRKEQG